MMMHTCTTKVISKFDGALKAVFVQAMQRVKNYHFDTKGEQVCFCIYCDAQQSNMSLLSERLGLICSENINNAINPEG